VRMEVGSVQDALRWEAIQTILATTDLSAASLPGDLQDPRIWPNVLGLG